MNEVAETQGNSDVWEAKRFESSQAEQLVGCMPLEEKEEEGEPEEGQRVMETQPCFLQPPQSEQPLPHPGGGQGD